MMFVFSFDKWIVIFQNRLRILQGPDGYVYVLQTSDEIKKQSQFDDLGDAEMLVYQCIERSENQGIWLREIKTRTGLHSVLFELFL